MHWFDWLIVVALLAILTVMALAARRLNRSVTDFLAAGRSAGRYVLTVAEGVALLGAITIVAFFEQSYEAGFAQRWWDLPGAGIMFVLALTGWVLYRFRQTRAMTMAQFFEMRYSRRFRVFAGTLAFAAGIINFGIFPAVGANFFVYYCGLPLTVDVFGWSVATTVPVMVVLLGIALFFTFIGGQIAVIVTDFIQGTFLIGMLAVIFLVLSARVQWEQISETMLAIPAGYSRINPLDTSQIKGFDKYFFLIGLFVNFYAYMSWLGTQGYNCSARNPHEARMGKVLGTWRQSIQVMLILFIPICAFTYMNHPDFAAGAARVQEELGAIADPTIRKQVTVPLVMRHVLPVGALGGLAAVMLAAFISTHDTYLHSWGSMFIQDVVVPFRRRPFAARQQMRLLRVSICGVAIFIFLFSLLYRQSQYILMFFALTGAIYMGGAGAVMIGGLYWRRGSTLGAWAAMISSATLATAGLIAHYVYTQHLHRDFPLDGQRILFFTIVISAVLYVVFSWLDPRSRPELERILHRGEYAIAADTADAAHRATPPPRSLFHLGPDFSRWDRVLYAAFIIWVFFWFAVFLVGTLVQATVGIPSETWLWFWRFNLWLGFGLGTITVVWFGIGGARDIRDMFRRLSTADRDYTDDGRVTQSDS
ncbi:MAG: sodium:solute symporter [Phycisphaerae bacterium]|nr:sodium:solute symporter [Phycisphaerae bacterium]